MPSGLYTRGSRCSGGMEVCSTDLSRTIPIGVRASLATLRFIVVLSFLVLFFLVSLLVLATFGSPITIDRLMDKYITPSHINIASRRMILYSPFHF